MNDFQRLISLLDYGSEITIKKEGGQVLVSASHPNDVQQEAGIYLNEHPSQEELRLMMDHLMTLAIGRANVKPA